MRSSRSKLATWLPYLGVWLALLAIAPQAQAALIAEWRFEDEATFLLDTSGNGHHLSNNGAAYSAESPGGFSDGSAEFDGDDILQTISTLDLSAYNSIVLSWWQFVDNGKIAILFEHSLNTNDFSGSFQLTVNEAGTNGISSGAGRPVLKTTTGYNGEDQIHAIGEWQFFTMAIDLTQMGNLIVEVTNGIEGPYSASDVVPFRNDTFNLGSRATAIAALGFVGNIDEFRIEAVPEPSSGMLLGLAMVSIASFNRRRQRNADA